MKIPAKKAYVCLLLACSVSVSLLRADNLLTAIDTADVQQVKQLLKSEQFAHSSKEYKKRVRKAAYKSARTAQKLVQCIPRGYGLLRMSMGLAMGGFGVGVAVQHTNTDLDLPTLGFVGVAGMYALWNIYRGWKLHNIRKYLSKAREIEVLVAQQVGQE